MLLIVSRSQYTLLEPLGCVQCTTGGRRGGAEPLPLGWRVTQSWTPGLAWLSKQSSARLSLPRSPRRRLSRGAVQPTNLSGLAGPTDNEYGGTEYGGLPVNYALFVIMLCCSGFRRASVKAAWSARSSSQLISGDIRDEHAHPAYAHPGNPRQSFAVGAGGHDIGRLHQGYGRHRHDPRPEDGRPADHFAGGQVELRPAIAEDVKRHRPAGHDVVGRRRHASVPR